MKTSIRKTLVLLAACPLFMAVLCEKEEVGPLLISNETKVRITEASNFSIGDTLWIQGNVSSMLFNQDTGDSIMNTNEFIGDIVSVMRLKESVNRSNTVEAIAEFEIVPDIGSVDFLGACPTSELIAQGPLSTDGQEYKYKIGLIPANSGDFVLSWLQPARLKNSNLNTQILESYPVNGNMNYLGLMKCGITYTIEDVNANRREFFFSVN